MEDIPTPNSTSPAPESSIPQAGSDPQDPSRRTLDEDGRSAPIGAPGADMDTFEDKDSVSNLSAGDADDPVNGHPDDDDNDNESELSEIDEAQFDDFDPTNIDIEERPVAVDESNVNLLKAQKRKRPVGGDGGVDENGGIVRKKKRKEGRKEKSRRRRAADLDAGEFSGGEGGEIVEGKRRRRGGLLGDDGDEIGTTRKERQSAASGGRARRAATPEDEENLTPEERRKRALDRKMDAALKGAPRRTKASGIDLEASIDELIETMRIRMTDAAKSDTEARQAGKPAMAKLVLLPEVLSLLNRTSPQIREQLVDPDTNLLEAVRFFLEPLNDGSLPAYKIQQELFSVLGKLPIGKDALVASGIGKVTLFYTKSTKPEQSVKRMAERLLGDWTRPILKRSDDYRKRELVSANYEPGSLPERLAAGSNGQGFNSSQSQSQSQSQGLNQALSQAARERKLAIPGKDNRARVERGVTSYTIVPRSNRPAGIVNGDVGGSGTQRIGASADDALRKIKMKNAGTRR